MKKIDRTQGGETGRGRPRKHRPAALDEQSAETAGPPLDALQGRRRLFVLEYLQDLDAPKAYVRAGYRANEQSAAPCAARLMQDPVVAAAIAAEMASRSQRLQVTADDVVLELKRLAFSRVRDVVRFGPWGVELRPMEQVSDDAHAAIKSVKSMRVELRTATAVSAPGAPETAPTGGAAEATIDKVTTQVTMYDKLPALIKLGEHLGMWSGAKKEDEQEGIAPGEAAELSVDQLIAELNAGVSARRGKTRKS